MFFICYGLNKCNKNRQVNKLREFEAKFNARDYKRYNIEATKNSIVDAKGTENHIPELCY